MGDSTGIEWTDATWNPVRGCSRVSRGCRICYAAIVAARFSGPGLPYEGLAYFDDNGRAQWTGEVRFIQEHLTDPLRWQKPRRIFVNSMSDLFHEDLDVGSIAAVFGVMAACYLKDKGHTFQVLTKRPERMRELMKSEAFVTTVMVEATHHVEPALLNKMPPELREFPWPLPNVWLGVSVEDQKAADERIPLLCATPATVRFLSCEPLIEAIDLRHCGPSTWREANGNNELMTMLKAHGNGPIHWVIVGGESGHERDSPVPFDLAWGYNLRDQCQAKGIQFFFKQVGTAAAKVSKKGGTSDDIPIDLLIREMPGAP